MYRTHTCGELNIKNVEDWNNVSSSTIMEHRGWWIFNEYKTLIEALSAVYPEVEWEESRRIRYPRFYWNSKENVENFLKKITSHLKIDQRIIGKIFKIKDNSFMIWERNLILKMLKTGIMFHHLL